MRRSLLALALLLSLTTPVAAQEGNNMRARFTRPDPAGQAPAAPIVTIDGPTTGPDFSTTADTIELTGSCAVEQGCVSVTWANDRGGSGTATGTASFTITSSGGGSQVKAQDDFTTAANVDIDTDVSARVPSPLGTEWQTAVAGAGSNYCQAFTNSGNGYVRVNTLDQTGVKVVCLITPATAISGTNYSVSGKIVNASGAGGNDEAALIFGYVNTTNFCGVGWLGTVANPDLILFKVVAGTPTVLGSVNSGPFVNDTIEVIVDGPSLTVKQTVAGVTTTHITTSDGACDNGTGVGIGFGSLHATSGFDADTKTRIDDFTVTDLDTAAAGITLQSGVNVITVTGCDGTTPVPVCGTDVIRVTKGESDTEPPVMSIVDPTPQPTYQTATAALTVAGTCTDNTACSSVSWTCPQCSGTSGAATGTSTWTFNVTLGCSSGAGTENTITATGQDAATNSAAKVLKATCATSDSTDPSVTITSPTSSATYTAPTNTITLGGTASDNISVASVVWTSDFCGSGAAQGTTAWTAGPITLASGVTCTITVTALDPSGNDGTDSVAATWTNTLTVTTSALPVATVGSAYSACLVATGGTPPYTWTKVSGTLPTGTTLVNGCLVDADGVNVGTEGSYTNHVYRATDSAGMPATADSAAMTLTVVVAGTGPHAYFDARVAQSECIHAWSLRPLEAQTTKATDCSQPRYRYQLRGGTQGYAEYNNPVWGYGINYLPYLGQTDTDPQAQDAAKLTIPPWIWLGHTLTADVASTCAQTVMTLTDVTSTYQYPRNVRIDSEWMQVIPNGANTSANTLTVNRCLFGTSAAAHTAGTQVNISSNAVPTSLFLPINAGQATRDGYTYLVIVDMLYTDSWLCNGLTNHKTLQLSSDTFTWFETGLLYRCHATEIGDFNIRSYQNPNGPADWTLSNGNVMGPGTTANQPIAPQTNPFIVKPNRWYRHVYRIQQRANDYDLIDYWIVDENGGATQTHTLVPMSVRTVANTIYRFSMQFATSSADHRRPDDRTLVVYLRNAVILESAGTKATSAFTDAAMTSTYLIPPIR